MNFQKDFMLNYHKRFCRITLVTTISIKFMYHFQLEVFIRVMTIFRKISSAFLSISIPVRQIIYQIDQELMSYLNMMLIIVWFNDCQIDLISILYFCFFFCLLWNYGVIFFWFSHIGWRRVLSAGYCSLGRIIQQIWF